MNTGVTFELGEHRNKKVIFIRFDYDQKLIERVKKLIGVKWSQSKKCWYVIDNKEYRKKFGIKQKELTLEQELKISVENQQALKRYKETLILKGYSPKTLQTYTNEFASLLVSLKSKPVESMDSERLRSYFLYCFDSLKLSENTIHSRINAVKFFFEQVLRREKLFLEIPRPKKPHLLPNVLAISEIERLFATLENLKHKTMIYLAYSAGMRVSEVVEIKVSHIHSARMVINLKAAKGKKDRTVKLSAGILELLRKYYSIYKPKEWLFEGQYGGQYSSRSLQAVFQKAKILSKVSPNVSFHSLRHSYATHLHERGTDIKLIQELLGHNDIKTTLRYTHVSNRTLEGVNSPFDDLNIKN